MRWRSLPGLIVLVALATQARSAERPPYTPEQLSLIREVTECRISPDGKTVACVSDITGALELWTVATTGGWPSQLTSRNERVESIRWSPDGRWIVFTSDYGGNERRDLFRVPSAGGRVEKLTDTKLSESEPRFSPDGKRLAFIADPDREFLFQLHVMDLETRKVKQLTKEPVNVLSPVWSRDGKTIAVTRSGDEQKGELLLVNADTGDKVVVEPPVKGGIVWPEEVSPDGSTLLLRATNAAGFMQMAMLKLEPSTAGQLSKPTGPMELFGPGDSDVTEARWHKRGIFFLLNHEGVSRLYEMANPKAKELPVMTGTGVAQHLTLDTQGSRLVLLHESVVYPADVLTLELN